VKIAMTAWIALALILVGISIGRASDKDEASVTAQVSSADHEAEEGYFTLGPNATLMVKPGSDLYNFLNRQRGRKIKVVLTEGENSRELSRIER
jgi:hypothetical protein